MKYLLLIILSVPAFSQVSVQEKDDLFEITWQYQEQSPGCFPKEVGLVGDYFDWDLLNPQPLIEIEKGIWQYKLLVNLDFETKYKFIVDGDWIEDQFAPDVYHVGFGGLDGFIDVAAIQGRQMEYVSDLDESRIKTIYANLDPGSSTIDFEDFHLVLDAPLGSLAKVKMSSNFHWSSGEPV